MIDTAGGDKVPRKGGPGITQSDLLVVIRDDKMFFSHKYGPIHYSLLIR